MTPRRKGLILAAVAVVFFVGAVWSAGKDSPARSSADTVAVVADTTLARRVIVYYLHTSYRCASCRKLEAYTKEAIERKFADQLKSGLVVWRTINVDEKANAHFVKDYKLYTKSVIVIDERFGRQTSWKNLAKVWELLGDKAAFLDYVQDETRAYLSAS